VHLFKTCSYRVKELGPLSLKSWLTEILTRHEMSLEGTYSWISGLGKKPHWQLLRGERKRVFKKAKSLGVPRTRVLGANSGPHIHPGDVLSVNEKDEVYHLIAKPHTDSFCNGLLDDLMPVIEKGVCDRGNNAVTKGYNDGENTRVTPGDKVAKPLPLSGTTKEDVQRMMIATDMVYELTLQENGHPTLDLPTVLQCPQ